MRNLFASVLILLIFSTCSSSNQDKIIASDTDKFIELKDAISTLKKSEKLNYSLSDCQSLKYYNLLYAYLKISSSLDFDEIILTKEYENIEVLIANPDKNLISYFKNTYGIEIDFKDTFKAKEEDKIDFPILKYKNRVLVSVFNTDTLYKFIIDLRKPQKITIALIYFRHDNVRSYDFPIM